MQTISGVFLVSSCIVCISTITAFVFRDATGFPALLGLKRTVCVQTRYRNPVLKELKVYVQISNKININEFFFLEKRTGELKIQ